MIWRRLMLAVCELELLPIHLLDRVGRLARGLDAQLELFHCVYEPEVVQAWAGRPRAAEVIGARVEERRRRLERLADVLRDQGLKVQANVRWDTPTFESIVRHVERNKPDLLIIPGLHLDKGLRAADFREERLIRECPAPVLFLKTREVYSQGCIVAALDPQPQQATRDLEETVVGAAKTVSSALAGAPVRLFSAVLPGGPDLRTGAAMGHETGLAAQAGRVAESEARLRRLAAHHAIAVEDVRIELGEAASLALYAREGRAQMIVLGAGSRVAAQGDPGNPFVEKILEALDCDLLVVKARHVPDG